MMATETSHDPIRTQIRLYVKNDEDLVEHLLRVGFSSFTSNPLNLAVMAPTSEGKTWAITHTLKLFENAHFFTGATPKTFFYETGELIDKDGNRIQERVDELRATIADKSAKKSDRLAARGELRELSSGSATRVNLEGRLLVFLDAPEHSLWNALKPLLSHDLMNSTYSTVDKTSVGAQRTKKIILHGWPACVFASARDEDQWAMWPELRTRFGVVSPSSNPSKYYEANRLTSKLFGLPSFLLKKEFPESMERAAKDEVKRIRQAIESLRLLGHSEGGGSERDNFSFNPFAAWLDENFPHDVGSKMRAFRNLHSYINLSAFMNFDRRPRIIIDGHPRALVVAREDVASSLRLILGSFSSEIPPHKIAFYREFVIPAWEAKARSELPMKKGKDEKLVPDDRPLKDGDYKPLTVSDVVDYCNGHGNGIGPNRVRDTYLKSLLEVDLVKEEADPADRRRSLYTPKIGSARLIEKLTDSRNPSIIDREIPLTALKQLAQNASTTIVNYEILSDGQPILARSLEEVVNCLLSESPVQFEGAQNDNQTGELGSGIDGLGESVNYPDKPEGSAQHPGSDPDPKTRKAELGDTGERVHQEGQP
jgi:hypothetical protein